MNLRYSAGVGFFKQRVIGVIMLAVLGSLPLTGPLCETLCGDPARRAAGPDAVMAHAHCAPPLSDTSVDAGRDCVVHGSDTALLPAIVPATAPMPAAPHIATTIPLTHFGLTAWPGDVRDGGSPDILAPARIPLILRI